MLNSIQIKELSKGFWPNRLWATQFHLLPNWDIKEPYINRKQRRKAEEVVKKNKFGQRTMSYSVLHQDFLPDLRRGQFVPKNIKSEISIGGYVDTEIKSRVIWHKI